MEAAEVLRAAKFLLPGKGVDLGAWAVVACDQFTSEERYWKELDAFVGEKPSSLRVILPEIYLSRKAELAPKAAEQMKTYLKEGVLGESAAGYILTVRATPYSPRRIGLTAAVDLEAYDYSPGSRALVRATEGTIAERIPPRLEIRRDAPAEFSHIMLLYDDESRSVNEKLYAARAQYQKIYDFDLNMGGGHLEGYFIPENENIPQMFASLVSPERMEKKYGDKAPFLFAAGDGNHSLATAKEHWNALKKTLGEEERKTHPARFCLAEIVNVYDEGIRFEPIFRFVSGVDKADFENGLKKTDAAFSLIEGETHAGKLSLPESIAKADEYIADYLAKKGGSVDYVHGEENLRALVAANARSSGVCFAPLKKGELFAYVAKKGVLPKKTFSMGEGVEKRYYLEGKRITYAEKE